MKLHIHHHTVYRYANRVSFGQHRLLVRPRDLPHIKLESFTLSISPEHRLHWMRDLQENNVGLLDLVEPATELVVESEAFVTVGEDNPFDFLIAPEALDYPFMYDHETLSEVAPLMVANFPRDVDRIREWLHPIWHPGRRLGTLDLLQQINKAIYREINYQRRERRGVQTPAETLELNSGSCRDFATLFMETCRYLGVAARFVSGYMYHVEISGRMSMHGWAEVYLPGAGWIGFDPSWGILTAARYVPVAITRHPEHAPPISGTYFGTPRDFLGTEIHLYVKRTDGVKEEEEISEEPKRVAAVQTQIQAR
jgi:transglutaminase-like putative cysteine protease